MNTEWMILLASSLALGVIGAAAGAWLVLRKAQGQWTLQLDAQLTAQSRAQDAAFRTAIGRLGDGEGAPGHKAHPDEFARQLLALRASQQQIAETVQESLRAHLEHQTRLLAAQAERLMGQAEQRSKGVGKDIEQQVSRQLGQQREAIRQSQQDGQAQTLAHVDQSLQETLQRVTQWVQQAIQVEIDFLGQQQGDRLDAFLREQARLHAEQLEQAGRHAGELRRMIQLLTPPQVRRVGSFSQLPEIGAPVSRPFEPTPTDAVSARPPELLHTPLPRREPFDAPEHVERELSDEELDALPPELPTPDKPRKRILPAPRKPPLSSL
ncbi:hypothetical protein QTI66_08095 [Variovorax sp. J22R133]|uniref:hypothetical protein n=1 Tax=Variovorax brevis TaxID=3053503 RepID=UPI002576E967|nr:hypothetical protein [Variovorax sp. J22R133]MDM0112107.1 hypothetical protein [Variovorax sp. J22R133]